MGNKLGRKRQVVDEKYTKPQGLYHHKDVDHKKLKKLILDSKLAPCFPGDEENGLDLEECPICFLYYPSLNRSRCCTKGICTECFLQMKTPNSTHPTQCPFCKTSNYAVEYRGSKTKEEKGLEQIEEQRVIEAKIRMQQQELQDEEERMVKREMSSASIVTGPTENEYSLNTLASAEEGEGLVTSQESQCTATIRQPLRPRHNRYDESDMDLEDIMVMEAVWLSIQENGNHQNLACGDLGSSENHEVEQLSVTAPMTSLGGTSSSSGFARAIASLAESQHRSQGESSSSNCENSSFYNALTVAGHNRLLPIREEQETENHPDTGSSIDTSLDSELIMSRYERECVDHRLGMAEVGSNYAGSQNMENRPMPILQDANSGTSQHATTPIVPESFEEQMMLAMAVSLAEARAMASSPGVAWN
ncbi:hypothetical protein LIER_01173 [Lithospermum erythrorhizon]|uniref:RING-type domain-containing protein n=1 Tax=Lithospermum erythrorhizon TaxID=34254 RepID=A0AAV3NLG1_LITER